MKKKIILFLIVIFILLTTYFVLKKIYEQNLKKTFYSYAIEQNIPEDKIRKTELIYYSKSKRYEYNIYIKGINDDKYFNFFYILPENQVKSYFSFNKINSELFGTGVYINGSITEINDKNIKQLLEK